jgi:hypothetical protein
MCYLLRQRVSLFFKLSLRKDFAVNGDMSREDMDRLIDEVNAGTIVAIVPERVSILFYVLTCQLPS